MSTETEIKLHVSAHEALRAKLEGLGATLIGRFFETNYILDRPDGSLRRQGCGLRVRVARDAEGEDSLATLTFKGPCVGGPMKSREEVEVGVENASALLDILSRLGFGSVLEYEKRRESWLLEGCRVELDTPAALGRFVEIEGAGEEAIRSVQRKIGLSDAAVEARSYVSMLLSYCERVGRSDRVIRLETG